MASQLERGSFLARRCALGHVQAVEASSRQTFARHTHEEYGIGRMIDGGHRSWSGRGLVEAGPGELIMVNPGEVHDGAPIGEARTWRMLYFAPEAVAASLADIREGVTADFEFAAPVVAGNVHLEQFEAAYGSLVGPRADAARGEERLIFLFAALARDKRRSRPPDNLALARAKVRIDDEPAALHTLADLARLAGISRFQLVRGFVKLTGLTPHAYVVQRRLDTARKMVAGGAALADVAAASGFADQSHLTRAFARRYGLTPGAYAAAMR